MRVLRWLAGLLRAPAFDPEAGPTGEAAAPDVQVVRRIEQTGGTRALAILRLPHGLFRLVEETLIPADEHDDAYLSCTYQSGLYATAEDAERDARLAIPWLRGEGMSPRRQVDADGGAA